MSDIPITGVDISELSNHRVVHNIGSTEFSKAEEIGSSVPKTTSVELLQMSVEEDLSLRVAAMLASANDDLRSPLSDVNHFNRGSVSERSEPPHGTSSSKIYEYILQLESGEGRDEDEWENDDDNGYMTVQLSEEEFYELEEEASRHLLSPSHPNYRESIQAPSSRHFKAESSFSDPFRSMSGSGSQDSGGGGRSPGERALPVDNSPLPSHPAVYDDDNDVVRASGERETSSMYDTGVTPAPSIDMTVLGSDANERIGMLSNSDAEKVAALLLEMEGAPHPSMPTVPLSHGSSDGARVMPPLPPPTSAASEQQQRQSQIPAVGHVSAPSVGAPSMNNGSSFPATAPAALAAAAVLRQTARKKKLEQTARENRNKRQSVSDRRRSEIMGQEQFIGADAIQHCYFNLKIIFEPYKTGFEASKDLVCPKGTIIAGRYEVMDILGQAAFSTALQCADLAAEEHEAPYVCLKVIKNNKDFFDQSLDEIKLLQYINSRGDADENHVLRLVDFFYCKEHLIIVSELLKENLYEFGRFIRESDLEPYYTLPRLKRIMLQVLEALEFIHSLKLIHCDIKPENIVIKSFSRCEVKLIDFGSSCFTTDHLTTYIQSRSYRAPEVILGHPYDSRIDIWSMGAVLAELYTGYVLFQNDSVPTMLSRITGIMGHFPKHVLSRGKETGKYFSLSNMVFEREEASGKIQLMFPKRTTLQHRLHMENACSHEDALFIDFVGQLLNLDPVERLTASEALCHPWMADAATVYFTEYIIGQPAAPIPAATEVYGSALPPMDGEEYDAEYFAGADLEEEEEGSDEDQGDAFNDDDADREEDDLQYDNGEGDDDDMEQRHGESDEGDDEDCDDDDYTDLAEGEEAEEDTVHD